LRHHAPLVTGLVRVRFREQVTATVRPTAAPLERSDYELALGEICLDQDMEDGLKLLAQLGSGFRDVAVNLLQEMVGRLGTQRPL
jgi:hypothetical protein